MGNRVVTDTDAAIIREDHRLIRSITGEGVSNTPAGIRIARPFQRRRRPAPPNTDEWARLVGPGQKFGVYNMQLIVIGPPATFDSNDGLTCEETDITQTDPGDADIVAINIREIGSETNELATDDVRFPQIFQVYPLGIDDEYTELPVYFFDGNQWEACPPP